MQSVLLKVEVQMIKLLTAVAVAISLFATNSASTQDVKDVSTIVTNCNYYGNGPDSPQDLLDRSFTQCDDDWSAPTE